MRDRVSPVHRRAPAVAVFAAALAAAACSSSGGHDGGGAITAYAVVGPAAPESGTAIALAQFAALLNQATDLPVTPAAAGAKAALGPRTLVFAIGPSATAHALVAPEEVAALPAGSYVLRRGIVDGSPTIAAVGRDDLGTQYGAYAVLARLGFGFFHPEETFVPEEIEIPASLDETWRPSYRVRGMHVHTMHPIELMDTLLVPSDEHLAEAKRYVDWLVANRQSFFQWVLQDTIDVGAWVDYAAEIVAYAHRRGIEVGIDTPLEFIQQNGFVLAPDPGPFEPQVDANLALLMPAGWDVVNVEMGTGEAIPADDRRQFDMLNYTAERLDAVYGARLTTKVHITEGQTAPNFGDINFNFLPGIADPRVGVMPHTVQWYDLYRRAPSYGHEDFTFMREFLEGEIGEREVLYYPETAYWVTFDVDIPLFLPHYVYARWNDLHRLEGSGMDGQVNFTSGFEWGYWLHDWATAAFAYEASTDWADYLRGFTRIFGDGADAMQALLVDVIDQQGAELLEENWIAYLIGWDAADDFGDVFAGINFQPRRTLFREIRRMGADDLEDFAATVLPGLAALETTYDAFVERVGTIEADVPAVAAKWWREIARALEVTALRVKHVRRLNEGVVHRRRAALGLDPDGEAKAQAAFDAAQGFRRQAEGVVALQEADYRWPAERIARWRENPTSYEFGYLYTTWDCYYWRREELQAIDEEECVCLGNITNLVANLFGEGHPLDELVRSLPPIEPCLDQCAHPVMSIQELGGSQ